MDEIENPGDLERKVDQASRIASRVNDPTTYQRLTAWIDQLRQRLRDRLAARRSREKIRMRATSYGSSTADRPGEMRSFGSRRSQNYAKIAVRRAATLAV
jgi:hypothetical protein